VTEIWNLKNTLLKNFTMEEMQEEKELISGL
jgi:hypothetical protein